MKIKAVIFDMDGVLIDAKDWHYEALNRALRLFGYEISRIAHLQVYDGLPTKRKLEILSAEEGLPVELHSIINELKQKYTMEYVHLQCKPRFNHEYALSLLKRGGYQLALASNSIRETVLSMLGKAQLLHYFDVVLSNQDVKRAKPDPEIYQAAIARLALSPGECLVVEDNDHGIEAAKSAGAKVLVVRDVSEVTGENIRHAILQAEQGSEIS